MRRATTVLAALALAAVAAGCGGDDPAGSKEPSPDDPVFGFNELIEPGLEGNRLLAESGASFVRVPLNWSGTEPEQGTLNFTRPDAINEELERYGLRPLWVVTSAPCWASVRPCARPQVSLAPTVDRSDEYADFAVEVAERYPDSIGIEVWNEPNIPNFWRPQPSAQRYRELLAATADAVHESGSEVPVVMAGPSPTTERMAEQDPGKIPFVEFIETVMEGPDAPDVDAVGVHPYSLLQRDADPIEASIRLFEQAAAAAERVAPEKPVWVTEVGLTTEGQFAVEPEVQASGLARIYEAFAAAEVPLITVHRFFDQRPPTFAFEQGFGVVAADGSTPKESFCALAEAAGTECES